VRRLLLPVVLMVVLATVFQLSRASAGWRFIVPENPGALLYATAFDTPDAWEEAQGRLSAQVENGVMRLEVGSEAGSVFAPLRWHFTDFEMTVDTTAISGPATNGFGIIFRLADSANYYYLLIGSDGYYQLTRVRNGIAQELSTWIPSEAIQQGMGARNRIQVIGIDDQFQFFVNDQPLLMCIPDNPEAKSTYDEINGECMGGQMLQTVQDSAIADGRLGVIAVTLDEPDVVIDFDNVLVYSPESSGE
jgi:hypothetical protein